MKAFAKTVVCFALGLLMSAAAVTTMENRIGAAEAAEIQPIAKYEFKDPDNFGKDSMGNYDMEYRRAYVSGATGELLDKGTAVEGGGVTFDGEFCIAQDEESNMFADVTAFTLCFEIKTQGRAEWQHYIGVGGTKTDGDDYFSFVGRSPTSTRPGQLRINAHDVTEQYADAPKIYDGVSEPEDYLKVAVSVQPGEKMTVYLNGEEVALLKGNTTTVIDTSLAETWTTAAGKYFFSIGGSYNGAVDTSRTAKGTIRNVSFYDFAMDAACVTAYDRNGKITTEDVAGIKSITGAEVSFESEATNVPLNSSMTAEEMLSALNEGTAVLSISDGSQAECPIVWTEVEVIDGRYYANGRISTSKLGYANAFGSEVTYELTVSDSDAQGEFLSVSISAAEDLGLNFYAKMPGAVQSVVAEMSMDGVASEISGTFDSGTALWRFTYPVAAKEYDKDVTCTITEVDGERVADGPSAVYSVKDYIDEIAAGNYEEKLKTLASSIGAYCEAAKVYFDADAAGSAVKVTEGIVTAEELLSYKAVCAGAQEGVGILGATLVLESRTAIHIYFTADDAAGIICTVGGETVVPVRVDGTENTWVIKIEVVARDLDKMQQISIGEISIGYGAWSYAEAVLAQDTENAALYNVIQAMLDYGYAADEYFV